VLFNVASMKDYGQLSNRKLEEQQAGARVAVEAHKKNPGDFVLWKLSGHNEPGWESPWGRGRPGWHIECSEMSRKYLGEVFDIHGGGLDLIFPHHENEIAQSRCTFGTDVMANVWMHNGFLQVEGQKMSKSLGNFLTISELLETERFGGQFWFGDVIRLAMLKTHYRQPIDWTAHSLSEAFNNLGHLSAVVDFENVYIPGDKRKQSDSERTRLKQAFEDALLDDLNTPRAFGSLMEGVQHWSGDDVHQLLGLLGIDLVRFSRDKAALEQKLNDKEGIESFLSARREAREAKNWAESDRIRNELDAMGVAIKDNKDGTTSWEVKR
jgi:cysteinyl-tRNA synthetase